MENYFGIVLLAANAILLILTARRINRLMLLKQDYCVIERNITAMIKENADIVEIILEELENKLKETRDVIKQIRTPNLSETAEENNLLMQQDVVDQSFPDLIKMYKKGMPVQEIAERIGISQDEIKLKLNLYKRNTEETLSNC